jgi:hypothetical protein
VRYTNDLRQKFLFSEQISSRDWRDRYGTCECIDRALAGKAAAETAIGRPAKRDRQRIQLEEGNETSVRGN